MKKIKVFAPGTVANLGCGFDVMGLALEGVGDILDVILFDNVREMEERVSVAGDAIYHSPFCVIAVKNSSDVDLPESASKNVVTPALDKFAEEYSKKVGTGCVLYVSVEILSKIRPGSGIGSSAASSAAAVYAINELLDRPFSNEVLVDFAMEGERLISGTAHADNVGPAILGGILFIRGYNPTDLIRLPVPENFYCTVVHPHIMVSTKEARDILPEKIYRKEAITQWGNVGGFIAALYSNDMELLGRSVQDVIAEPYRKKFIPGYDILKDKLLAGGMIGVNIAGSGPSVFAFSEGKERADMARAIMQDHFSELGVECEVYVTLVGKRGARVID